MNIEKIESWTDEAERALNIALQGCAGLYREQVNNGRAELWHIDDHSYAVTRIEENQNGQLEMVVCLYQGRGLNSFVGHLIDKVMSSDIAVIRFHTKSAGLGRWMVNQFGFVEAERVYRLQVH